MSISKALRDISQRNDGFDFSTPRRNISCMPALPQPISRLKPNNEKSISEKVAEARRTQTEPTPMQRLFSRKNSRTATSHARSKWGTLLVLSNKGRPNPNNRVTLEALPYSAGEQDLTGDERSTFERPKLPLRSESTKGIRRGRTLFRSIAPRGRRRHARSPLPRGERVDSGPPAQWRRRESLSPEPRGKGKKKRCLVGTHKNALLRLSRSEKLDNRTRAQATSAPIPSSSNDGEVHDVDIKKDKKKDRKNLKSRRKKEKESKAVEFKNQV